MYNNIILFDGVCNFCDSSVNFIIDRDKKNIFKFAALQSEKGQEILEYFSLPKDDFDSFVFIENDKVFKKSSAALKIANKLGGIWKIFYPLIVVPKFLRDFFYSLIANNRYKLFGKKDACRIPTPELKQKFL
ncbi:MAG: thiol-disulfide oxidoreductase DCC family protein [Bacteroidetes bacterium]|nr:thiol-disulfide oxidoreductase DCC family protein [Bacteroidota bacterium]